VRTFEVGDVIAGKYEVTRVLGRGGMGVVVAARHRDLDALVALKFLLPSVRDGTGSSERFAREARTGMRIKNEHVARVYDVGVVDGTPTAGRPSGSAGRAFAPASEAPASTWQVDPSSAEAVGTPTPVVDDATDAVRTTA
jgi:serine/threonine protein kinase